MIRRLLVLAFALLAWWAIRRWFRYRSAARGSVGSGRSARQPGPRRVREAMVRDRVCNTFLPRSRAIVHHEDGREHYFCSESCRSAYLTQKASPVPS